LINCKYMVCSRRCIVVTIDGALYNVDVDVDYGRVSSLSQFKPKTITLVFLLLR
jgi:hypothetical protein